MEYDYRITLTTMLLLLIWLGFVFGAAIFLIKDENEDASTAVDNYDLFIVGYDLLNDLSSVEGLPSDWYNYDNPSDIGIMTGYNIDFVKIDAVFNMSQNELGRYVNISSIGYKFELLEGNETLKAQNKDVGNGSVRISRYVDEDYNLVVYLWRDSSILSTS